MRCRRYKGSIPKRVSLATISPKNLTIGSVPIADDSNMFLQEHLKRWRATKIVETAILVGDERNFCKIKYIVSLVKSHTSPTSETFAVFFSIQKNYS